MPRVREILPSAYLALCLLLGGASNAGVLATMALQLLGVGLMVGVFVSGRTLKIVRSERHLILFGVGLLLVGLVQLIPLPPAVWTHLGGRADIVHGFALMKAPLPWLPVSLWPAATVSALVALLPPLTIIVLLAFGGVESLKVFAWTLVILTAAGFLVGFVQLAGGQQSPFYFYHYTNRDQLVGWFANSNHMATLGVMALPFVVALSGRDDGRRQELTHNAGKFAALACLTGFIILGVVADGSVAGILLLVPSLIGCFVLLRTERAGIALPVVVGVVVVALALFVVIAFYSPLLNGFGQTDLGVETGSRPDIYKTTWRAIRAFVPTGSGLGSFLLVYPGFASSGLATAVYVNHAHSDYLEFLLETGVAGAVLIVLFLIWWARQTFFAWRDGGPRARFARAASIASALVMAHSLMDYPMRTAAIATLFAACCAMVARPLATVTAQPFSEGGRSGRGKMIQADV